MLTDFSPTFGLDADDLPTHAPARASGLKWAVVVDTGLPAGLQVNAASLVAASFGARLPALVGYDAVDAAGGTHAGLPWLGCVVLGAPSADLTTLRAKAATYLDVLVVGLPAVAQRTTVYDAYAEELARTAPERLGVRALGLLGPRNRVDRLTKDFALLD